MASKRAPYALWQAFGVEIEYMIVDTSTLDVRPLADRLLVDEHGQPTGDRSFPDISWSNELAAHVLELKTSEPSTTLHRLSDQFQSHVRHINAMLAELGAQLLPTAMHPWMDPDRELTLWPHDNAEIYAAFNRVFGCGGHGWSNLQSAHLNLPFSNDGEFARLHAAIRLWLPLIPALAASSPIVEGKVTGLLDNRVEVYQHNSRRIPSVTGGVIPEPMLTHQEYDQRILQPMYAEMRRVDPDSPLCDEWLNARGAIARFSRSAIEIRLVDTQEAPLADLAIHDFTIAVLRALCDGSWSSLETQNQVSTSVLRQLLVDAIRVGPAAIVEDETLLKAFGQRQSVTVGNLLDSLFEQVSDSMAHPDTCQTLLRLGPLASRIVRALEQPGATLHSVYHELGNSLQEGRFFQA